MKKKTPPPTPLMVRESQSMLQGATSQDGFVSNNNPEASDGTIIKQLHPNLNVTTCPFM
jgi:hypothetical protein